MLANAPPLDLKHKAVQKANIDCVDIVRGMKYSCFLRSNKTNGVRVRVLELVSFMFNFA